MPLLVENLPSPGESKIRWPWTVSSENTTDLYDPGVQWPRISIITPSYNQGHFIEETIRSVLLQNYPNLEYIIIDGGSTDNTCEIIKKYESKITYWVSESDRGQTHAINKGLEIATGDIIAYLNSDDYYLPNTLFKVAEFFLEHPEIDLLNGKCRYVDEVGEKIGEQFGNINRFDEIIDLWSVWWGKRQFVQPEVFWSKRISDKIGSFREDLHYVMDYEYWCRILLAEGVTGSVSEELTCFRFTPDQKSNQSKAVADELIQVIRPWLWDSSIYLPIRKRLFLQGEWIYQAVFLKQISDSLEVEESSGSRYKRTIKTILQNPQILCSRSLYKRMTAIFSSARTQLQGD